MSFFFNLKYGDLAGLIKSFKRNERENFLNEHIFLEWSLELFDGLFYMHSKNIVHRDLTPTNIYLYKNENSSLEMSLKIGDFGISRQINSRGAGTFAGTLYYQSPQIVGFKAYSEKTDVW